MFKYSLSTNFAFIFSQSNVRLDLILIAGVGSSSEMGLYVIALAYASLQAGILSSVLQLILPKISSISGLEERVAFSVTLSRMAVAASVIVGAILAGLSSLLIPLLFGQGYKGSISLAIVLLGGSSVAFANAVLADCLRGVGLPKRPMVAEATSFFIIGLLLLPSYWQYGLHGVASVAVLGGIVSFICLSRYVSQDMNVRYGKFLLLTRSDVAFVAGRLRNLWQYPRG
jgi:O-antigen/teichoic acid export membrane protein